MKKPSLTPEERALVATVVVVGIDLAIFVAKVGIIAAAIHFAINW